MSDRPKAERAPIWCPLCRVWCLASDPCTCCRCEPVPVILVGSPWPGDDPQSVDVAC